MKDFQKHYQQRDAAAKAWKQQGGQVVGYFCDSVPDELISAAGFFPYRLSSDAVGDADLADQFEQTRAFETFVRTMLHMLLSGQYDFLDYLVIPHSRTSVHLLYPLLTELKERYPDRPFPKPYFLEVAHTTFLTSQLYNRDRLIEFKHTLETWAGRKITDTAMTEAIAVSNENRRLLKEIEKLRVGDPPRITGEEALQIIGPSMWMTKQDHNQLLKTFLARSDTLQPRSGARVYLQSSPLDDLHLTSLIESCGAVVVSEGHCWGIRNAEQPIDPAADPLDAIVDRYQFKPPCSRTFPMARRRDLLIRQVTEADARGVIFFIHAEDAQAWEVYEQGQALKAKGIPFLVLTQQPYRIADPDALKQEIGNFVGAI